jgi:RNA polymerase sigma-70 factor, ECF subfamily
MPATAPPGREDALLAAARRGDEDAYRRLVEPHRRELHAHCYRMLGSVHDADDAVQDALLRAWRGLPRFEGRSTTRSWLYKVTTNTCLTEIERRPRRALPRDLDDPQGVPAAESAWLEPYPDDTLPPAAAAGAAPDARYDQREAIELAFIAALQHLPANQRAALILREVLGFSAREVAELLETSVPSVNSALQRARRAVDDRLPERSQQSTLRTLGDARLRDLVARYVEAWERGDVDAVVSMLADDATFSMPPNREWYRGPEAIREFLPKGPLSIRRRFVPVAANGQPAFATYREEDGRMVANAIHVLTLRGGRIIDMTAFLDPSLFAAFGAPLLLDP